MSKTSATKNPTPKNFPALRKALRAFSDPKKVKDFQWFFKTKKGEYAEGDTFLGVTVPQQRRVAKEFFDLPLPELTKAVRSPWHEERLTALFIAVAQYKKGDEKTRKQLHAWYLGNTKTVNNWDLVDSSAEVLVGPHAERYGTAILTKLAQSKSLWERRIAMIATFHFIKQGSAREALNIATILRNDGHDLIQKAVGWMLREVGKRVSVASEEVFLKKYAATLPRTALRYALEHFPANKRAHYMNMRQS